MNKQFICVTCSRVFNRSFNCNRHMKKYTREGKKTTFCKVCNRECKNRSNYLKHIKTKKHINMTKGIKKTCKMYHCNKCNYNTNLKTDYTRHLRSHERCTTKSDQQKRKQDKIRFINWTISNSKRTINKFQLKIKDIDRLKNISLESFNHRIKTRQLLITKIDKCIQNIEKRKDKINKLQNKTKCKLKKYIIKDDIHHENVQIKIEYKKKSKINNKHSHIITNKIKTIQKIVCKPINENKNESYIKIKKTFDVDIEEIKNAHIAIKEFKKLCDIRKCDINDFLSTIDYDEYIDKQNNRNYTEDIFNDIKNDIIDDEEYFYESFFDECN